MAKKLLAILAALCLVAAMGSVGASAVLEYEYDQEFATGETVFYTSEYGKGEFNILVIPDAHQTADPDVNLIAYIEATIKYMADMGVPLDLIIFLGDNVTSTAAASPATIATAVGRLLAPVKAAKIPYTLVFGNHDLGDTPAGSITGAELLQIWKIAGGTIDFDYEVWQEIEPAIPAVMDGDVELEPEIPAVFGFVTKTVSVPLFAEPDATAYNPNTGTTNFKYTIKKKVFYDGIWPGTGRTTHESVNKKGQPNELKEIVDYAQLFLFDIGSKDAGQDGYPYVRENQLDWFDDFNDDAVPAYVFQHIPLPEVYTGCFFLKSPFNWELPWTRNILGVNYCGKANYVNMVGTVLEAPNPPRFSDGEFGRITAPGNVRAAFFGHDHINNYVEKFEKIDLVQLPGAAWAGSYGTYLVRGGSFVSIRPNAADVGETYWHDFFTYRQASRVGGYGHISTTNGIKDWIKVVPFLFQNLLIDILAPFRWIGGGF